MATEITIQCGTVFQGYSGDYYVVTDVGHPGDQFFYAGELRERTLNPESIELMCGFEIHCVDGTRRDPLTLRGYYKAGCLQTDNNGLRQIATGLADDFKTGLNTKGFKVLVIV